MKPSDVHRERAAPAGYPTKPNQQRELHALVRCDALKQHHIECEKCKSQAGDDTRGVCKREMCLDWITGRPLIVMTPRVASTVFQMLGSCITAT